MTGQTNDQTTIILREMLKWIKFAGMKEVKSVLLSILDTEQKKLAYHLSDGTKGTVEIGKLVSIGQATVDTYWKSWLRLGLGENIPVKGGQRFQRSFDLEDFGIKVPRLKAAPEIEEPRPAAETQE